MMDIVKNFEIENSECEPVKENSSFADENSEKKSGTAVEENSDQSESDEPSSPQNNHSPASNTKRARKTVQRLSETWNKAFEAKEKERVKHVKIANAEFEAGKGVTLGSIEAVENNIRKTKVVDLKPLHQMIYGRAGTMSELRTNLRKFHGFGFSKDSQSYEKKVNTIQQRPNAELRNALKILHLEVSGNREARANRLMEFLLEPTSGVLKNSGALPKKTKKQKTKSPAKTLNKSKPKGSSSSIASADIASPSADGDSNISSEEEEEEIEAIPVSKPKTTKRAHPSASATSKSKKSRLSSTGTSSISAKGSLSSIDQDSDEDMPLASLKAQNFPTKPSDEELKESIVALLKTVNLEETSLKVVRQKIFERYSGVDLTDKKDFINMTVKEYLSQS